MKSPRVFISHGAGGDPDILALLDRIKATLKSKFAILIEYTADFPIPLLHSVEQPTDPAMSQLDRVSAMDPDKPFCLPPHFLVAMLQKTGTAACKAPHNE